MGSCCGLHGWLYWGEDETLHKLTGRAPGSGAIGDAFHLSGIRIDKAEERAVSLKQLRRVGRIIDSGCTVEKWTDAFPLIGGRDNPTFGQQLLQEDVNMYQLNYYLILPRSVPKGVHVVLADSTRLTCRKGQTIRQKNNPPPHPGEAVGQIHSAKASDGEVVITVQMARGCFTTEEQLSSDSCNYVDNMIAIDGKVHERPICVHPIENCSYMESISEVAQPAQIFCSHFWGEPFLHFVQCCEEHAKLRGYDTELATYWVCAFANRQHDLGMDIDPNPENTSFRRAMRQSLGTLLILDQEATPFSRIWCDYEIFTTLSDDNKFLDIVTLFEGQVHVLADGLPSEQGDASYKKTRREEKFPIKLLAEGMRRRVEDGRASQEVDKIRILNRMRGHCDLDDRSVTSLTDTDKICFNVVNDELHAIFAIAAWPQAVLKGIVFDFDASGDLSLPNLLRASTKRCHLAMDFTGLDEQMRDDEVMTIARSFPSHLLDLRLSFWKCPNVTDIGVRNLADNFSGNLAVLRLIFFRCEQLTDAAFRFISQALPPRLERLELDFSWCRQLTALSLEAIGENLPRGLTYLRLLFRGCGHVTDAGLAAIGKGFPECLTNLVLDFRMCSQISDAGIGAIGNYLPCGLVNVRLSFGRCKQVTGLGLEAIKERFPQAAIDKSLNFTVGRWEDCSVPCR